MKFKVLMSTTMLIAISFGGTGTVYAETGLKAIARQATSNNPTESSKAIASLRSQGQAGIEAFFDTYKDKLQSRSSAPTLHKVLDTICKQRDCYASRLYWYTDLAQAKAAATSTGKPILSLRLLGRLDEDLSCANSRFFRIALYPNAEVSKVLRDRYILHWQSVRPVPKVTIDFGDGRKMERTLTGNSIHYILNAEGQPIEALPGLYSPQVFLQKLAQSETAVKNYNQSLQKPQFLSNYHRDRLAEIQKNWAADLSTLGISLPLAALNQDSSTSNATPTAEQAAPLAVTKMVVERPILRSISPNRQVLATATTDDIWSKIAQLHKQETRLDANSQLLMQNKNPQLFDRADKNKLQQAVNNFESLITLDTVRNEYLLHSQIHQYFINGIAPDVDSLNDKVYAEVFLTPKSDPWLGLLPNEGYTAIENDGIAK